MSAQPKTTSEDGLDLWIGGYEAVRRWMSWQFRTADEQELHDSITDAWNEMRAKGIHTAATGAAIAAWRSISRLRQLDRIKARRYRDEHGLGSVALTDDLTEVLGRDDREVDELGEDEAAAASMHELIAHLDRHLSDLEQQYLLLRWHHNLSRPQIAGRLGISMAKVGRLNTATAKCVRSFYAARDSGQLCAHNRQVVDTLVTEGRAGVLSHPELRAHLGNCPNCQQLATDIPHELRGAAPIVGTAAAGVITATASTAVIGGGGMLAGMTAGKLAVVGAALFAAASVPAALHSGHRPGVRSEAIASAHRLAPPTSIGSITVTPRATPKSAAPATHPARHTPRPERHETRSRPTLATQPTASAPEPRTTAASASDVNALTRTTDQGPAHVASAPHESSRSAGTPSSDNHDASSSDIESAFGVEDSH